jgi:hypothetical protein
MKSQKLLAKARPAVSVVCPGCERECVMPVHTVPAGPRDPASFIVCDKRDDINRVPVSAKRLMQWRCDADAVCGFIAASLGLRRSDQHPANAGLLNIGIASGNKRSQMLCLPAALQRVPEEPPRSAQSASKKTGLIEIDLGDGKRVRVDADVDAHARAADRAFCRCLIGDLAGLPMIRHIFEIRKKNCRLGRSLAILLAAKSHYGEFATSILLSERAESAITKKETLARSFKPSTPAP